MIKLKYEDALEVARELRMIFHDSDHKGLTPFEMTALGWLKTSKTNNLKEIKQGVIDKHPDMDKDKIDVKIAKVVKALIDKDLIVKSKCEEDKRILLIKLTDKAEAILEEFRKETKQKWEEAQNG